jgi:cell division protein FtsZ
MKKSPLVKWVGVGSAGCHILKRLALEWSDCPPLLALHTRQDVLDSLSGMDVLTLGEGMTEGMSTGGDAEIGRKAAAASIGEIENALQGVQFVVLLAGLGGGTGSGAVPLVAEAARRCGARTLAFCTLPFFFEGALRRETADQGLVELKKHAEAVILFPNQRLLEKIHASGALQSTFDKVSDVVASSLRGLWKLLTQPGVIQLDFADLCRMITTSGGVLAMAQAEAVGSERAAAVVRAISDSPLLEHDAVIGSAAALLIGVLGGPDLTLTELQTVVTGLSVQARTGVELHFGATVDPEAGGRLQVVVLASETVHPPAVVPVPVNPPESTKTNPGDREPSLTQTTLPLNNQARGRFEAMEPTVYRKMNLDEPTYLRRGLRLSGKV